MPRFRRAVFALACVWLAQAGAALATTPVAALDLSPDVAVDLSGVIVEDEALAADDGLGPVVPLDLGPLPGAADLAASHEESGGERLLSLDVTADLPGLGATRPSDVARWDGAAHSLAFDGIAAGVPDGARIDAVARSAQGDLLLSFDVAVDLPGAIAHDEDLVRFDPGSGDFALHFDGSDAGLSAALDLDAAEQLANGHLLLSFDSGGAVAGVPFDDDDVLEYDPLTGIWEMHYVGSEEHPGWGPADLDALSVLPLADGDGDGVPDVDDNCPATPNPGQQDSDLDTLGNACDCDFDNDGACDIVDFTIFLDDFQLGTPTGSVGTDMDGNGSVGIEDFALFLPGFTAGELGL